MEPRRPGGLTSSDLRDELLAVVHARQELSPQDEEYLIENFLGRLDVQIDAHIDRKLADLSRPHRASDPSKIILPALGIAVPLSAIAGGFVGLSGLIVTWIAIVIVVVAGSHERKGN